jgi:phospholipid transport system substrate-binding protein
VRVACLAALCAALLCLPSAVANSAASAAPDAAQATKVVEELHAAMLDVMKNGKTLGFEGRRDQLGPAIAARYDFPFIAEKSVGLAWKEFDAAQREQLVDATTRLAGATYAARMKDFGGERFETLGTQPAPQNTMLVRTRIVEGDGKVTSLDYRLHSDASGQPRVIDVFMDGTVSELALRRSEYSSLLKKGGFAALLEALQKKIAEQAEAAS